MYGFYNDKEVGYCIVMEFMEEGSLDKFLLSNRGKFEVKHFVDFSFQISLGMVYLSSEKIIHRDLALRNILVSSKKDRYIVKISDFGLSRQTSAYRISDSKLPVKWSAPETYLKHESTIKSDVWSFGIVLWEIFCEGLEPYVSYYGLILIYSL